MANNRLILVEKSTGRAVVLGKHFGSRWGVTISEETLDNFFEDTFMIEGELTRDNLGLFLETEESHSDLEEIENYRRGMKTFHVTLKDNKNDDTL
jgi:hypothetical protein